MTKHSDPQSFELSPNDPDFPTALGQTHPAVARLYGRGRRDLITAMGKAPGLAIVGSRQATHQGLSDAHWYASVVSKAGMTVISGLAQGIDASAHSGALTGSGNTIAVLGHGLQTIYPPQHQALSRQIVDEGGAIVTEYPVGTPALPAYFPQRNRIIAALSRAVLVVEATPKSGSLITARHALDLGIDVFVVPGSIHMMQSTGCNALIRQGAQLTQSPEQLLEDLGVQQPDPQQDRHEQRQERRSGKHTQANQAAQYNLTTDLDPSAQRALQGLNFYPTAVATLEKRTGVAEKDLYGALLVLELCGLASRTPDGKWLKYRSNQ